MKKRASNGSRPVVLLILVLVSLLMISSSFTMLANYSDMIGEDSGNVALEYINGAVDNVNSSIEAYKTKSQNLVKTLLDRTYEEEDEFITMLFMIVVKKKIL